MPWALPLPKVWECGIPNQVTGFECTAAGLLSSTDFFVKSVSWPWFGIISAETTFSVMFVVLFFLPMEKEQSNKSNVPVEGSLYLLMYLEF